jgi:hypothetical protein
MFFNLPNPSGRTGVYSASNWNEYQKQKHDVSVSWLSKQCGTLNISQPYRPPLPATEIALLYFTKYEYALIPDEIIAFFKWPYLSIRTPCLGSPQPLIEMSTRDLPCVKVGRCVRMTTSLPSMSRSSIPALSNAAPAIYSSGALRKHIIWANY